MRVASTALLFMAVVAAGVSFVSELHLSWVADRLARLCRKLGGDPPHYHWPFLPPGPQFWEYMRRESRRCGRPEFQALLNKAEVALVVYAASVLAFLACVGLEVLLRCLAG